MDLLTLAAEGFKSNSADSAVKEQALKFLQQWLTGEEFAAWDGSKTDGGKKIASSNVPHQFDAQLFLDPQLLFEAAQSTLPSGQTVQARQFQAALGLFVDAPGFFPNVVNSNAKWLRGQPNQFGWTWYFVRENGEFVAWNGRTDASGRKFASGAALFQFDAQVFLNPEPLL